jgi:hypothetical protein
MPEGTIPAIHMEEQGKPKKTSIFAIQMVAYQYSLAKQMFTEKMEKK